MLVWTAEKIPHVEYIPVDFSLMYMYRKKKNILKNLLDRFFPSGWEGMHSTEVF